MKEPEEERQGVGVLLLGRFCQPHRQLSETALRDTVQNCLTLSGEQVSTLQPPSPHMVHFTAAAISAFATARQN